MRGIWGMGVGMQGIGVGMQGMRVGLRGMVEMRECREWSGNARN